MLRRVNDLIGFAVRAIDDNVGHVEDFYLDSLCWKLAYMVVDTGPLFFGRKVLIAPDALEPPVWDVRIMPVVLAKKQVESSPEIDLDKPVSRQNILTLHQHYGWPASWTDDELLGATYIDDQPRIRSDSKLAWSEETRERADESNEPAPRAGDRYLRSAREIIGYHIAAADGEIGHVEDLFIDEDSWDVSYLLVDTSNWLGGRHVLIAVDWIERVGWTDKMIHVNLTREKIKDSPEYEPGTSPRRGYEVR